MNGIRPAPGAAWRLGLMLFLLLLGNARAEAPMDRALERIRHEWATVVFGVAPEKRAPALETLSEMARGVAGRYPDSAQPIAWEGIVLASYADARGPVFGYFAAQRSRDLLLEAGRREPSSLAGFGFAALAGLYWNAAPWPLSFGDRSVARAYLAQAGATAPDTVEAHLRLAELHLDQGDTGGAARSAQRALAATGRRDPGDEVSPGERRNLVRLLAQTEGHP